MCTSSSAVDDRSQLVTLTEAVARLSDRVNFFFYHAFATNTKDQVFYDKMH